MTRRLGRRDFDQQVLRSIDAGPQGAPFAEFVSKLRGKAQGDAEREGERSHKG